MRGEISEEDDGNAACARLQDPLVRSDRAHQGTGVRLALRSGDEGSNARHVSNLPRVVQVTAEDETCEIEGCPEAREHFKTLCPTHMRIEAIRCRSFLYIHAFLSDGENLKVRKRIEKAYVPVEGPLLEKESA